MALTASAKAREASSPAPRSERDQRMMRRAVRLVWLVPAGLACWRDLKRSTRRPGPQKRFPSEPRPDHELDEAPFGYDLRRGAAAYAPIVGAIGGFVVPAVVLVFEIASRHRLVHGGRTEILLGRATALLVLGLIACLLGAFAFAAIGAERKTTPSLIAAVLYAGVGTTIGVVAIMAAFEALAALYLEEARDLFAGITIGAALAGVMLVALVLGDAWSAQPAPGWLKTRGDCNRWAQRSSLAAGLPVLAAGTLYFAGIRIAAEGAALHVIVAAGIGLSIAASLGSMFRTVRGDGGEDRPVEKREVIGAMGLLTIYLVALVLLMP